MSMKRILVLLCFAGMFSVSYGQYDKKALDILDAMSAKYQNMVSFYASFSYTLENEMENIHEEFSGDIIVKGDMFKLDLGEQEVYNDGETMWTYLKDVNEVNIDYYFPEDGEMTPTTIFSAYKSGYKYLFIEEETIENNVYYVIDLIPDDQEKSFFKARLWIQKSNNTLFMWKLFDKTGNTYLYSITKFDDAYNAKDEEFVFDSSKYPGITEIDLR
jgi:outer membrane lipoprotein-sorting protein